MRGRVQEGRVRGRVEEGRVRGRVEEGGSEREGTGGE